MRLVHIKKYSMDECFSPGVVDCALSRFDARPLLVRSLIVDDEYFHSNSRLENGKPHWDAPSSTEHHALTFYVRTKLFISHRKIERLSIMLSWMTNMLMLPCFLSEIFLTLAQLHRLKTSTILTPQHNLRGFRNPGPQKRLTIAACLRKQSTFRVLFHSQANLHHAR